MGSDPSKTTQMLLDMHTREIEGFYMTKQQELLQELKDNFEKEVAKLRSQLERDMMEVNQASQRAVKAEVENFKMHRLPAITSLLAPHNFNTPQAEGHQQVPQAMQPIGQPIGAPLTSSSAPMGSLNPSLGQVPLSFPGGISAEEVFRQMDVNGDGVLDRREFEMGTMALSSQQHPSMASSQAGATGGATALPRKQQQAANPGHTSARSDRGLSNEVQQAAAPHGHRGQQQQGVQQQQQLQRDYEAIMAQLQAASHGPHGQQGPATTAPSSSQPHVPSTQAPPVLTNSQGHAYKLATAEEFTAQLMSQQLPASVSSGTIENMQASLMAAHIDTGAIGAETAQHIRQSLQQYTDGGVMPMGASASWGQPAAAY